MSTYLLVFVTQQNEWLTNEENPAKTRFRQTWDLLFLFSFMYLFLGHRGSNEKTRLILRFAKNGFSFEVYQCIQTWIKCLSINYLWNFSPYNRVPVMMARFIFYKRKLLYIRDVRWKMRLNVPLKMRNNLFVLRNNFVYLASSPWPSEF